MIDNLPTYVATKLAPHLYYKKYPFKIEITLINRASNDWHAYRVMRERFYKLIQVMKAIDMPEDTRTRSESLTMSLFLPKSDDVVKTIEALYTGLGDKAKDVSFTLWGMDESQEQLALADAKIEFKKQLYLRKFEWRLEFSGTEDTASIEAFFDEDGTAKVKEPRASWQRTVVTGERFKLNKGNTWKPSVLYLKNEDDAVAARMMIASKTTIKKAVVVA